jgi:hypothetical protein
MRCAAPATGQRSPDRSNTRNGYRHRGWDTRAGSIDLAIHKVPEGTYFRSGCWSGGVEPGHPELNPRPLRRVDALKSSVVVETLPGQRGDLFTLEPRHPPLHAIGRLAAWAGGTGCACSHDSSISTTSAPAANLLVDRRREVQNQGRLAAVSLFKCLLALRGRASS